MRAKYLIVLAAVLLAGLLCADYTQAQLSTGVVIWRHDTNLEVDNAADFDGSSRTADEKIKEWDAQGSGMGLSMTYDLPAILSIFGEVGISQMTVRDEDVVDPNRDVNTLGMDDALYLAVGMRPNGSFPNNDNLFWSVGLTFSMITSDLDEDINVTWEYKEQTLAVDGQIGYMLRGLGIYGGLRFANYSGTLDETDTSNPVGQQVRSTEFDRDGKIDVMVGAMTSGGPVVGLVELGFIGAFTARTGISYKF
ncbi:MAG: hypothetical protein GTO51_05725 [Candidatus Latescibacteria bacterium]|nr:hypothetical protein [Candidatus Latescibacterota bacterium]NIM65476.1 hypothetical protein [Candidatus Latescibacterota bacterium]NIO28504.1 hypothetical protein [Candidatus Latescibacterota bacterium]NIO56128.1 hypothetical protein [Candidatus Latescibacterota bacterium]